MMAKNSNKVRGSSLHWTNERHLHFLNSMEASFVQSMYQNNHRFPPLDRFLPDSSESTQDRQTRHSASESSERRTERKNRNLSCQKSSQDQVVPRFPNKRDDNKDKDDKDLS